MKDKTNHLYVDSHERKIIIHSLTLMRWHIQGTMCSHRKMTVLFS